MIFSNFLYHVGEYECDDAILDQEAVLRDIIQEHLGFANLEEKRKEQEHVEQPTHTIKQTYDAVQILINYVEDQDTMATDHFRDLKHLETVIIGVQEKSKA